MFPNPPALIASGRITLVTPTKKLFLHSPLTEPEEANTSEKSVVTQPSKIIACITIDQGLSNSDKSGISCEKTSLF